MSSETSIDGVRLKADATKRIDTPVGPDEVRLKSDATSDGLHPWQFFILAGLGCATAAVFILRGRGLTAVLLVSLLMAAAALVGFAALRALRPLVSADEDRTPMHGQRTRVALEREKMLALRSIKELEFDRAMGKLSDADWREMSGRLRARATRLMRQLDAGAGYRDQIERDLEARLSGDARSDARLKPSRYGKTEDRSATATAERDDDGGATASASAAATADRSAKRDGDGGSANASASAMATADRLAERICASCATVNDSDARFCKSCGSRL